MGRGRSEQEFNPEIHSENFPKSGCVKFGFVRLLVSAEWKTARHARNNAYIPQRQSVQPPAATFELDSEARRDNVGGVGCRRV